MKLKMIMMAMMTTMMMITMVSVMMMIMIPSMIMMTRMTIMSGPVSPLNTVLCKFIRPAVSLHLADPKMVYIQVFLPYRILQK